MNDECRQAKIEKRNRCPVVGPEGLGECRVAKNLRLASDLVLCLVGFSSNSNRGLAIRFWTRSWKFDPAERAHCSALSLAAPLIASFWCHIKTRNGSIAW